MRRLGIPPHALERISVEEPASRFCAAAGVSTEDLCRRSRGNYRAAARKVFAYISHRWYGFAIVEVGAVSRKFAFAIVYSGATGGGRLANEDDFVKVLIALRP